MKPYVFKSHAEIDKFLTKNGYNDILANEEGWHLTSNDMMELQLVSVIEPAQHRPDGCTCEIEKPGYKRTSCTKCFEVGYQYVPPKEPIFIYDEDAINFVFQQALRGSKRHQFAIRTNYGTKQFHPFAVIEYSKEGCDTFTYCTDGQTATTHFCDTISEYGFEPSDKSVEDGFVDIEGGFRVVLVYGGPREIK